MQLALCSSGCNCRSLIAIPKSQLRWERPAQRESQALAQVRSRPPSISLSLLRSISAAQAQAQGPRGGRGITPCWLRAKR